MNKPSTHPDLDDVPDTSSGPPAVQVETFTSILWNPNDLIKVRIVHGTRSQARTLRYCAAAELPAHVGEMSTANQRGWNIYAGLNPRLGRRRGDESVALARCLFADREYTDKHRALAAVAAVGLPPPTLTVNSGHGIHTYWRLAEAIEPSLWRVWQQDLAALLGTDPKVVNPERVARLPGFDNVKSEPVPCRILECDPSRVYDLADLPIPMRPGSDDVPPVFAVHHQKCHGDSFGDAAARCRAYLAQCPNAISGNRGHDATYAAACTCNRFGLTEAEALDVMAWFNAAKCVPPWSDREIRHKVADAYSRNSDERAAKLPQKSLPTVSNPIFTIKRKRGVA